MTEGGKKWTRIAIKVALVIVLLLLDVVVQKSGGGGLPHIIFLGLMVGVVMYKPKRIVSALQQTDQNKKG